MYEIRSGNLQTSENLKPCVRKLRKRKSGPITGRPMGVCIHSAWPNEAYRRSGRYQRSLPKWNATGLLSPKNGLIGLPGSRTKQSLRMVKFAAS